MENYQKNPKSRFIMFVYLNLTPFTKQHSLSLWAAESLFTSFTVAHNQAVTLHNPKAKLSHFSSINSSPTVGEFESSKRIMKRALGGFSKQRRDVIHIHAVTSDPLTQTGREGGGSVPETGIWESISIWLAQKMPLQCKIICSVDRVYYRTVA